jgi:hypothetical protein
MTFDFYDLVEDAPGSKTCGLCGFRWQSQEEKMKCFGSHAIPERCIDVKYKRGSGDKITPEKNYPDFVTIKFNDGAVLIYKNDGFA